MPIAGGPVTELASRQDGAHGLAVDRTSVYWTAITAGTVMKVPLGGGALGTLASGSDLLGGPTEMALSGTTVYFTNWVQLTGTVMDVPLDGGPRTTIADGQEKPYGIVLDAANVYFTNSAPRPYGNVRKVPLNGGPIVTLASGLSGPYGIAMDATSIYWVNHDDGTVMKISRDGGATTTLATGQQGPYHLAVDATSVYWGNYGGDTVMKLTPK
jgi:hypothetical protein